MCERARLGSLPDQFRVRKFQCPEFSELASETRSLGAAEGCARIGAREVVDKHHSGLDFAGHAPGFDKVATPDRSTQTEVSDIGELDQA